jgi:putative tryptophan/tyrosine transport system substrate-binding protein
VEYQWAERKLERLPALAAEVVRLQMDAIVTWGEAAAWTVQDATSTIPIVVAIIGDLVAAGYVASLARPCGNITGLTDMSPELSAKRLELLMKIVLKVSRIAVLWNGASSVEAADVSEMQAAAQAPGKVALAAQSQHPTRYGGQALGAVGGLMASGGDAPARCRRAATAVDKRRTGAKPAALPVEPPTKVALVIPRKPAHALGLTIPPPRHFHAEAVLRRGARADASLAIKARSAALSPAIGGRRPGWATPPVSRVHRSGLPGSAGRAPCARWRPSFAHTLRQPPRPEVLRGGHPHAAGLDRGREASCGGGPEDRDAQLVRPFGPWPPDLAARAAWLAAGRSEAGALASRGDAGMPVDERLAARHCPGPTMLSAIGLDLRQWPHARHSVRLWSLPCKRRAAPGLGHVRCHELSHDHAARLGMFETRSQHPVLGW